MARRQYHQGFFTPTNKDKFIGSVARYLSSYELKFMRWADSNPKVIHWGSENVIVPYISEIDHKVHKYLIDFFMVLEDDNGKHNKFLVEIKPHKQTIAPKNNKRKKRQTLIYECTQYITNQCKWEAARKYASEHNMEFVILTEKELYIR